MYPKDIMEHFCSILPSMIINKIQKNVGYFIKYGKRTDLFYIYELINGDKNIDKIQKKTVQNIRDL